MSALHTPGPSWAPNSQDDACPKPPSKPALLRPRGPPGHILRKAPLPATGCKRSSHAGCGRAAEHSARPPGRVQRAEPCAAGGMQAALIPPASWAGALVKAPPSYLFPLGGEQGLRACGRPRRCVSALSDLEGGRPGPAMNTEGAGSLPPRQACLPGYVRSLSGFQECGAAMRPGTTGAALAIPGRGAGEQQSDQDQASRRGRLEGHLPSSARSWL